MKRDAKLLYLLKRNQSAVHSENKVLKVAVIAAALPSESVLNARDGKNGPVHAIPPFYF